MRISYSSSPMTDGRRFRNRIGVVGGSIPFLIAAGCATEEPAAAPATAAAPAASEQVTVGRVIDGDTFLTADGRIIGVLGIDSCEVGTVLGDEGKRKAEQQFGNAYNQPFTLTTEPGVGSDSTGRLMRYVQMRGYDYAEQMVPYDHTGAFAGDQGSNAAPAYLTRLQSLDTRDSYQSPPVGRDCDGPDDLTPTKAEETTEAAPTTTEEYSAGDGESDADRRYIPDPPRDNDDSRGGSGGGDGHPCGTGERDGDKDGLCGEI